MPAKRFLDSVHATAMNRAPYGVLRAASVKVTPSKIYFRLGSRTIVWYDKATFLQRIDLGGGIGAVFGGGRGTILSPDGSFSIDGGGWEPTGNADALGEDWFTDFDVDAQGCLYVAATVAGWGIVKDGRVLFQNHSEQGAHVVALKAPGRDLAWVSGGKTATLYDVTDRSNPKKLNVSVPKIQAFAKNADASRVAIVDYQTRTLKVFSADALASGAGPIFTGGGYISVTSDGRNFFALAAGVIDVISPAGAGYNAEAAGVIEPKMTQANKINYNDGHIVLAGSDTAWTWRIYKVSDSLTLKPVPFDPTPTTSAESMNALDGIVLSGRPILLGKSVADVYDSIGASAPVVIPSDPLPKEPTFEDQQSETVTQNFVIRQSELAARTSVGWLRFKGVTFAMYGQLPDQTWRVEWR